MLSVAIAQQSVAWDCPAENLRRVEQNLREASARGARILVCPEVMLTGFDLDMSRSALPMTSEYVRQLQELTARYGVAAASSLFVEEGGRYYNRAFLMTPDGAVCTQDKRHLFSMAGEDRILSPGASRRIIEYLGWRILLLTCYDLRFPVWCRNRSLEYDLLIVPANWPEPREHAWTSLLVARAIENQAYVIGANRVGTDPQGIRYSGRSAVYSYKGIPIAEAAPGAEQLLVAELDPDALRAFRRKFPVWQDADTFFLSV